MRKGFYPLDCIQIITLIILLLSAPGIAQFADSAIVGLNFIAFVLASILLMIILSMKTKSFLWPLITRALAQSQLLLAAQIILFAMGFLYFALLSSGENSNFKDTKITTTSAAIVGHDGVESAFKAVGRRITQTNRSAKQIVLPLVILGIALAIAGFFAQRKLSSSNYWKKTICGSIFSIVSGFLILPGFMVLVLFVRILTDFIRLH